MMIEAVLHLPIYDNQGNKTEEDRAHFENALVSKFGGLTFTGAQGLWRDKNGKDFVEAMGRYIVAFEDNQQNREEFLKIATSAMIVMNQYAIYLKIDSEVMIIENEILAKRHIGGIQ